MPKKVTELNTAESVKSGAKFVMTQEENGTEVVERTGLSALLNALKHMAGIDDDTRLLSPDILEPIQDLKVNHLGNHNPRLHTDETLLALSIVASKLPIAEEAMKQLENLKCCEVHSSVILSGVDEGVFRKLGMHLTCEPIYETKKLYHK